MRIQLPNETWMEILNWLNRRDLINKLDQLWDRQFTPIVQGWLHDYTRNVKIGRLAAKANGLHFCELHFFLDDGVENQVPIAQVEMPENITSFESIHISRHPLGQEMLAFLHRMRPLFRNTCLHITDAPIENEWTTRRYQTDIRLFIQLIGDHGQIETLIVDCQWLQFLADNFHDALFNARVLGCWFYEPDYYELMINWLFTRREDGQPRTLLPLFWAGDHDEDQQFCTRIRERFLDLARQPIPCPFFIRIYPFDDELPIPLITENVATGEQLTIRQVQHSRRDRFWLISNCPLLNVNPEFLTKKTAEVLDWDYCKQQRTIILDFTTEPPEDPFSRMMSTLKRMISNWRINQFVRIARILLHV